MIDKFAAYVANVLIDNGIGDEEDYEIYEYGINLILSGFTGAFIIIILSLIIGRLELGAMFLGVIIPVRMYTGGYHADTHLMCNFIFSLVFVFSSVLYEWLVGLNLQNVIWIAAVISTVLISCTAPVENSNKPITGQKKRKYKIISICMCIIVFAIVKVFEHKYYAILYINVVLVMIAVLMVAGLLKERSLNK